MMCDSSEVTMEIIKDLSRQSFRIVVRIFRRRYKDMHPEKDDSTLCH